MIQPYSIWRHKPTGVLHSVVGTGQSLRQKDWEQAEDEVVTWSLPFCPADLKHDGVSWLGSEKDFLAEFARP